MGLLSNPGWAQWEFKACHRLSSRVNRAATCFLVKEMKLLSHFFLAQSLFISEGKFSPDLPPVSLVDPMQAGVPPGAVDGRETTRRARVRNPLHGAMAPGTFGRATGLGEELLCPGMSI